MSQNRKMIDAMTGEEKEHLSYLLYTLFDVTVTSEELPEYMIKLSEEHGFSGLGTIAAACWNLQIAV